MVPGAPHFLNMTHAGVIQDPVEKFLAELGLSMEDVGEDIANDMDDGNTFNMGGERLL